MPPKHRHREVAEKKKISNDESTSSPKRLKRTTPPKTSTGGDEQISNAPKRPRRKSSKQEGGAVAGAKKTGETEMKSQVKVIARQTSSLPQTPVRQGGKQYWLFKSEPHVFSIDDFAKKKVDRWEGVRNPTASKFMREAMKIGDQAFIYHSSCKEPGIVGLATIVKEGYPDETAFDEQHKYYDPRSTKSKPRWHHVDLEYNRRMRRLVSLKELKAESALGNMILFRQSRLSVQPVAKEEWDHILKLELESPKSGMPTSSDHFNP